jgi:hypothetical protein
MSRDLLFAICQVGCRQPIMLSPAIHVVGALNTKLERLLSQRKSITTYFLRKSEGKARLKKSLIVIWLASAPDRLVS